jgi:hypothetical protein
MVDLLSAPKLATEKMDIHPRSTVKLAPEHTDPWLTLRRRKRDRQIVDRYEELKSLRKVALEFHISYENVRLVLCKFARK